MGNFPNIIYGKYGDEKDAGTIQVYDLGQRMILPDGRLFAYARANTAATIAIGAICSQKAVSSSGHVVSITGGGTTGNATVNVTLSATGAVTKDQFKDGYVLSYKGGTAGYMYKVKANNSGAVSTTVQFTLYDYDPLVAPIAAATTSVMLRENEFKEVLVRAAGTAVTGIPAGVAANSVAAGSYFWIQRRGPVAIVAAGTVGLVGEPATSATTTFGVQRYLIAANTATNPCEWEIGRFMVAPAQSTDYAMVCLELE